ncbi:bifunctional serine/threonine-protein kinase/formylglycine-generating enzyme family protein [Urbifossiella limnaea]|uniref:Serine/threonine-protein kinase PrkC n=1 Tax=Urbifossiella limnaea TaxID=2528023 RepID=A0A517XNX6_9BACT|nr:bifunctional serine/threonine-protein kinase/formylglycine-generating enzyme family protein [Urbifossiella limnaea]QDU19214.1 Serine/threonine-protein kinase PrkC [Urbifossiella limnaea]
MSADSGFAGLPLDAVLRVNARCDAFEAALRSGGRPRPDEFLGDATGAERDTLLVHLAAVAVDYYEPTPDEFVRRLAAEGLTPDPFDAAGTTAELAERLTATGALTAYQAGVLRSARPHPLALNDYVILDRVAAGGMGTVYRAVHRRMRREVALKVVADGGWFRREAEAAGRLAHPNIVTAYDAGEARGVSYLASEFVAGTDLRRRVLEHGPLSVPDAVRAIRDAAAGLAYAHGCGVIHRDVKPANLICTPAGDVRVLDVGLARVAHRAGSADDLSLVVGTPGYMAPEQTADPAAVDARADVYALGRTLAFLLTGRTPTGDDTPLSPDAPPALAALCRRMTAPDPADRPAAMADVLGALDAFGRRRRGWQVTVGLLVVAGGLGLVFRPSDPPPPIPPRPLPTLREVPFDAAAYQAEWAAALGEPVEIEPLPGLKARLIPPGRFLMGTPADPLDAWIAAEPNVTVRERLRGEVARPAGVAEPFYLASTETTVALFRRFVTAQNPPYRTTAERDGGVGYRLKPDGNWTVEPGPTWRQAGEQPLTDAHPVGNLGRDDCADFCRWLTRELGGRYECRLPTEVEWEYGCRAGEPGLWACGSDAAGLGPLAWFTGTVDAADGRFRPVGRKAPNRFGLFDVHGNLEEWCGDGGGVLRGGHVRSGAGGVRSAARSPAKPTEPRGGFRVALVVSGR